MAQVRITRELPHTEPPRRRHRLNGTPQTRRCSGCRRERSIFTGMLHSTCTAWLPNPTRPGETLQNTRSSREQVVPRRSKRNIEDRIAQRNAAGGRNLAGRTAKRKVRPEGVGALFSKPARSSADWRSCETDRFTKQNLPPQRSARRSCRWSRRSARSNRSRSSIRTLRPWRTDRVPAPRSRLPCRSLPA